MGLGQVEANTRRVQAAEGYALPSWQGFMDMNLYWPLMVQLSITLLTVPLSILFSMIYHNVTPFRKLMQDFIGTDAREHVNRPFFMVSVTLIQMVLSLISVVTCVDYTYTLKISEASRNFEQWRTYFFIVHYLLQRLRDGWAPWSVWEPSAVIDIFTIVPVLHPMMRDFTEIPKEERWLSLSFLRSYRALNAYERIEFIDKLRCPRLLHASITFALRTVAIVLSMAGIIFVLEVLGPYPGYNETFVETNMGSLSFVTMFYWVTTLISMVGFGDFSPTTAITRLAAVVFMYLGVVFFRFQVKALSRDYSFDITGKGKFNPLFTNAEHVVIVGSGVNKCTLMMMTFLNKLLDVDCSVRAPSVVLLSEEPFCPKLLNFVRTQLPPRTRGHVHLLIGNAMQRKDLRRAWVEHAMIAYVIPDYKTDNSEAEDLNNIKRAIKMKRYDPNLAVRLVLLRPDSRTIAIKSGIKHERCFAIDELTAQILAVSCRVKGFATLITGLIGTWLPQYKQGPAWTINVFMISKMFVGMPFNQAIAMIYQKSGGCVLPFAAQVDGRIILAYDGNLVENHIVLAIAESQDNCMPFADAGWHVSDMCLEREWRVAFVKARHRNNTCKPTRTMCETHRLKRHLRHHIERVGVSPYKKIEVHPSIDMARFRAQPSLIVLIVIGNCPHWQQIVVFLRTLRQPYLPTRQPVIVLSHGEPPAWVVRGFEYDDVAFLTGKVLNPTNLEAAGVQEAQTIVVFRKPQARHELNNDSSLVVLSGEIENLIKNSEGEKFTIFECDNSPIVHLVRTTVRQVPHEPSADCEGFLWCERMKNATMWWPLRRLRIAYNAFAAAWQEAVTSDETMDATLDSLPSREAGQIFRDDFFASMLPCMFHCPATMECIEVFTGENADSQTSFTWQVQCPPKWVGKDFGELQCAWISQADAELEGCGTVIVLAIYRQVSNGCAGCNVTLPHQNTKLLEDDLLTALGSAEFGALVEKTKRMKMETMQMETMQSSNSQKASKRHRSARAPTAAPPTHRPQRLASQKV